MTFRGWSRECYISCIVRDKTCTTKNHTAQRAGSASTLPYEKNCTRGQGSVWEGGLSRGMLVNV